MRSFLLFLASAILLPAQDARFAFICENYTKFEYLVPMRDGVKLFTSVYIPKDVFTDSFQEVKAAPPGPSFPSVDDSARVF